MKKDTHTTDIIFRKEKSGDFKGTIFALFPHECGDRNGHVTSYQHVGQHSTAHYMGCIADSVPATEEEYADLKREMESLGYNIKVVKKQNYTKFLESYNEVRKNLG